MQPPQAEVGVRRAALRGPLEALYREYGRSGVVEDPVECVRIYPDPADREIAGFIAAGLAFDTQRVLDGDLDKFIEASLKSGL